MMPEELIKAAEQGLKRPNAYSVAEDADVRALIHAGFAASDDGIARARSYAKLLAACIVAEESFSNLCDEGTCYEEERDKLREALATGGT